jgi:hypothetical protein
MFSWHLPTGSINLNPAKRKIKARDNKWRRKLNREGLVVKPVNLFFAGLTNWE